MGIMVHSLLWVMQDLCHQPVAHIMWRLLHFNLYGAIPRMTASCPGGCPYMGTFRK